MSSFTPDLNILNPALYDTANVELNFYQRKLVWPWRSGNWHALGWVFFAMGLLAIYGILNLHDLRLDSRRLKITITNRRTQGARIALPQRTTYDRISTHMRAFAYHRAKWLASVSIGMCTLIITGAAYPLLYVFTQRPYYAREPWLGPPPLAGRAGMIAIAQLPFVLALGMKANVVSVVTGVGHEKLNVLHRWLGMLMGLFSVIHAVPYFVEPVKQGGWGLVKEKFEANWVYWNGVAALACLFWLCVASLPFIRAWCYELFVHMHIMAGVGFVAMLFWHCNNMLTSWHYLYASTIIWGGCLLHRLLFRTNFLRAIGGESAHLSLLPDGGVRITIPTTLRWQAGQHVFIRIPSISLLDNHPFTVASFADRPPGEHNDLQLVFKPHSGFTRKVYNIARSDPDNTLTAFLDGPYGGLSRCLESFETVVLIAGGSGITPVMGHLAELAKKIRKKEAVTRDVRIIWTVKRFESLEWFKDAVSTIARTMPRNSLLVQYFITQETPVVLPTGPVSATREWPSSPRFGPPNTQAPMTPHTPIFTKPTALPAAPREVMDEATYEMNVLAMRKELNHPDDAGSYGERSASPSPIASKLPPLGDEVLLEFGRPPLGQALRAWSEGFGKRSCIYVCGPPGMKVDVANAVAKMQNDIWISDEREEVYLHTESFGW